MAGSLLGGGKLNRVKKEGATCPSTRGDGNSKNTDKEVAFETRGV